MALELTVSNRMEALVAALAGSLDAQRRSAPLKPVTIIVPNRSVAQFIRFRVAELLGVAANLKLVFLRSYLTERLSVAAPELRILDPDTLHLLLFGRLRASELEPVRRWVGDAPDERDVRALQLAGQVARLFEGYGYGRRQLVEDWRRGPQLADTPWARAEAWQREVWRGLFDADGAVEVDGARHMLLPNACFRVAPRDLALPSQLHVFGLSYVAPAFAGIFARLASVTRLRVYALNPCLEFWEDVQTASGLGQLVVEQSRFARRGAQVDLAVEDPFELETPRDTPALRLWGRPGREYVRLLDHLTRCDFDPLYVDPGRDTLLARLQRDVLLRAQTPEAGGAGEADGSVRFLACPGVRREVEVVADAVWQLLADDDANGGTLRFHDIAVMVTDADRATYLTHIEAVFRARHRIPFNVIDRRLSGRSRAVDAVCRLIELPAGPLGREEVLGLLTHPLVGGADADADPARWSDWVDACGVRFGADAADHDETYFDRDAFHWDQAARRVALGAFLTGEPSGDGRVFEAGEARWLAHETHATADAARFVAWVRRLVADVRAFRAARLSVRDWATLLVRLVTTYVQPESPADEQAVDRCVRAFEGLAAADLEGIEVPYAAARALALAQVEALDSQRGAHQADGVVVSSLLPMRAIPFEAVFVLGLGEGDFPARNRHDALDLRQARRMAGDVTPAERDRYLFLETLLATRDRLTLSYVSRDPRTGEPREPSSVVRELQYILRAHVSEAALDAMTVTHPVAAHDPRYFEAVAGEAPLFTLSEDAARAASAVALRADVLRYTGQRDAPDADMLARVLPAPMRARLPAALQPVPPPDAGAVESAFAELDLPLYAVQRFLESPLQGAARFALGLPDDGDDDEEDGADEPLRLPGRTRRRLLSEAFFAADPAAAWRAGYEREVLRSAAPLGLFAERAEAQDLAILQTWTANLESAELPRGDRWFNVRLARGAAQETVHLMLPALELEVPVGGGVVLPVRLHGPLQPITPDGTTTLRCIQAQDAGDAHFLPGFLALATLCAAGNPPPGDRFRALVAPSALEEDGARLQRIYRVPPADLCRQWFTDVLRDLLADTHDYRLPIQAVMAWRRARQVDREHARLRVGRPQNDADGWGPVRTPDRFRPPDERVAEDLVRRRFGLLFQAEIDPRR